MAKDFNIDLSYFELETVLDTILSPSHIVVREIDSVSAQQHDTILARDTTALSNTSGRANETANNIISRSVEESNQQRTNNAVDSVSNQRILPQPRNTLQIVNIDDSLLNDSVPGLDTISLGINTIAEEQIASYSYEENKEGVPLPESLFRSDGIFLLLLVCFLLLAHIYNGGFSYIKENALLVFSSSKSEKLVDTQTTFKEMFFSYFLVFLAVLLTSISLYEGLSNIMPLSDQENRPFVTIGSFIILLSVFIFLKVIFNKLLGYVFDISKNMLVWNQSYLVLLSIFGLLCFLPTLLLVYSESGHIIIIGFTLILFLLVQLILIFRIIVFFIEQKFNFLYLITYLCTVEILPYIYLGLGVVYLYQIDIFNIIL